MEWKGRTKKTYELWWKYLQQSDGYKHWLQTDAKKYDRLLRSNPIVIGSEFDPKWTTLYDLIGNVHTVSFNNWWERKKRQLNKPSIDHYANFIGREINHCWINMKPKPSDPEEFRRQFCSKFAEWMRHSPNLYIIVNPDGDLDAIKTDFLKMINEKKKEMKDFYKMIRQHDFPIGNKIHIAELEKYLSVFILKERQHKSWKEVISQVSPKYNSQDCEMIYEEARRIHQRHLQKAKAIIQNAENGRFPGEY